MRTAIYLCMAAIFASFSFFAAKAQGHSPQVAVQKGVPEARQFHEQFFSDPKIYVTSSGQEIIIGPFRVPGSQVADIRVFTPNDGRILSVASTALDSLTAAEGEQFLLKNHGRTVEWRKGDALLAEATVREGVKYQAVEIENGAATIAGRFSSAGSDRRPAIIFVHGSGPGDRNDFYYGLLSAHFVEQGFAVLTYDKRSVGKSKGGDWKSASMQELASDVTALVRLLKSRPDVDPSRIGIFGVSQASWVAPLAVMKGGISFLALFSGVPVDTWASEMNESESELADRKASLSQKESARKALRLMFDAAELGSPTPALVAAVKSARAEPWFSAVELTDTAEGLAQWRRVRYDPKSVLEKLKLPVFLAYGATDLITPYQQYAPIWAELAQKARGAENLTLKVYPGANHGLLMASAHDVKAFNLPFAPGAISELTTWLRQHAGVAKAEPAHIRPGVAENWRVLAQAEKYMGAYKTSSGVVVTALVPTGHIRFDDFSNGELSMTVPAEGSLDEFSFLVQEGRGDAGKRRMRYFNDGRFVIAEPSTADRAGKLVATRLEKITVSSTGLRQHGLLITPSTPGPHPVVMFFGGDGPSTRENFKTWGQLLAVHGYAALTFDKRGYGDSEGDPSTAALADLAQDGAAWFDFLSSRTDIDQARIGAMGLSRGGWTVPMLAKLRPKLAFMMISSGGPISVRQSERYNRLLAVSRAGHAEKDRATAATVLDDYFDFLASNGARNRDKISSYWSRYSSTPWFPLLRMPKSDPSQGAWPPLRTVFAGDLRLDAKELYRNLDIPIFFVFGGADQLVPNDQTRLVIADLAHDKRDWSVKVFDGAGHNFEIPGADGKPPRTVPGYYEALVGWLQQRVPVKQ